MNTKIIAAIVSVSALFSGVVYAEDEQPPTIRESAKAEYTDAVDFVISNGIMDGDENGNLNLSDTITRAELVKMLITCGECDWLDMSEPTECQDVFADVTDDHWAKKYIEKAYDNIFIEGYDDGLFYPEKDVTYAEAIKLVMILCGIDKYTEEYPYGYIAKAIETNVLRDMKCDYDEPITCRDAAEMIYNAFISVRNGTMNFYHEPLLAFCMNDRYVQYDGYGLLQQQIYDSGETCFSCDATHENKVAGIKNRREYEPPEEVGEGSSGLLNPGSGTAYQTIFQNASWGRLTENVSINTDEIINYFDYEIPPAQDWSITAQITDCPWSENKLARITAGVEPNTADDPSNYVFIIHSDIADNFVRKALIEVINELDENDTVSVLTYSKHGAGVWMKPTKAGEKDLINEHLKQISVSGGVLASELLNRAYEFADENLCKDTRIIICAEDDFDIGTINKTELESLISEKSREGIYLTGIGISTTGHNNDRMEFMAEAGKGGCYYADTAKEVKNIISGLCTKSTDFIFEDVEIQAEFNVGTEYRLIGYENKAGKIYKTVQPGEKITLLYELVTDEPSETAFNVKIRYKKPGKTESILKEFPVVNEYTEADNDTKFASAAAMLGLKLNGVIDAEYSDIAALARESVPMSGDLSVAERWEFIQLTELLGYID